MQTSGPDDRRERPLSVPEQQEFDRIQEALTRSPLGWRHEYVTVQLPKLSTAMLVMAAAMVVAVVVGTAAVWWAVAGIVVVLVLMPWLLLYATERGKVP